MERKVCPHIAALLAVLLGILVGCGHYPPVVDSAADMRRLPSSERSIRARGMADSDISSLARLHDLEYIDFSSGVAVEMTKITDEGTEQLAKLNLPYDEEGENRGQRSEIRCRKSAASSPRASRSALDDPRPHPLQLPDKRNKQWSKDVFLIEA